MSAAPRVMSSVPTIAGPMPPPAWRVTVGMSLGEPVRADRDGALAAPRSRRRSRAARARPRASRTSTTSPASFRMRPRPAGGDLEQQAIGVAGSERGRRGRVIRPPACRRSTRPTMPRADHVDDDRDDEQHDAQADQRGPVGAGRPRRTGWRSPRPWRRRAGRGGAVIWGCEPMTSATAMVSPMARPRPSITAPTMPPGSHGSTAPRIISHRVAPMPRPLPCCGAGHGGDDLAAERGDDRRDHDGQDDAGGHEAAGRWPGRRRCRRGPGCRRWRRRSAGRRL